MAILRKIVRFAAFAMAMLVMILSLSGMLGVWWANHKATEIVLKGFGLVETATEVADAGVARVDDLVTTSRTEVRQASETITTVGTRVRENSPVINALSERLETSLSPRIAQMREVLAPVRDAVGTASNAVNLLNSLPMVAERAPRLTALDEALNRLEGLSADTTQLRGTLRALVSEQKSEISPETIATLNGLTQRIDSRLGEVQANVQEVRGDLAALQVRLDARKTRMLTFFNLMALLATLLLAWIFYSQIVVIRQFRSQITCRSERRPD